jgi:hypothetical protein
MNHYPNWMLRVVITLCPAVLLTACETFDFGLKNDYASPIRVELTYSNQHTIDQFLSANGRLLMRAKPGEKLRSVRVFVGNGKVSSCRVHIPEDGKVRWLHLSATGCSLEYEHSTFRETTLP